MQGYLQHPRVQRILDSMTGVAAFVRNARLDILSANQLGHALYSRVFREPVRPANLARFVFLDPEAPEFYANWESIAQYAVSSLRAEAGRDPYDRALSDLIGEVLPQRSPAVSPPAHRRPKRLAFANDPLNLLAVDYAANRQKGDADTASWLPSNRSYRCPYVARQVAVKAKYQLSVTVAERGAMVRALSACPTQVAPSGGEPTTAPVRGTASPRPTGRPGTRGTDPRFATCQEAKAAGYGPYYRATRTPSTTGTATATTTEPSASRSSSRP